MVSTEHSRKMWKTRRALIKEMLLEIYGKECVCCGETDSSFLTLEHKNGGGYKKRKHGGTEKCWREAILERNPGKYEILCFNCNIARSIYGVCPHVSPRKPDLYSRDEYIKLATKGYRFVDKRGYTFADNDSIRQLLFGSHRLKVVKKPEIPES